jgi:3-dehydroquinate dehydratase-1
MSTLRNEPFAEIRIDKMELKPDQLVKVFSQPVRLIATCRPGKYNDEQRMTFLKSAIESGAGYVDIEIEGLHAYITDLTEFARQHKCKVILSYHNFDETPDEDELIKITKMCFDNGADLAKIVTMVKTDVDNARILSLYSKFTNIVAFGMGEKGKLTRVLAPLMGSEFTYAALTQGKEVAPGQIDKLTMMEYIERLRGL